jgi:acetyl esterase
MPIHPYIANKLPLLDGLELASLADPAAMAQFLRFYVDDHEWSAPDTVTIRDEPVPGDDGDVPIRVYRPNAEPRVALIWLHGGGFQGGNLDMPEGHLVAAELAHRAEALVVSVDYRLALNGVHYPAPVDDTIAAWRWLISQVGADVPIAIGGASAGAAIAISTALRSEEETGRAAAGLLLGYPFVHFPTPAIDPALAQEMQALPSIVRFNAAAIAGMVSAYVGRLSDIPVEAMPGAAPLHTLPPTTIVLSEYDDLRPSGELLAQQLAEIGVANETYVAKGMLHGHLNRVPQIDEVERSLEFFAYALRRLATPRCR